MKKKWEKGKILAYNLKSSMPIKTLLWHNDTEHAKFDKNLEADGIDRGINTPNICKAKESCLKQDLKWQMLHKNVMDKISGRIHVYILMEEKKRIQMKKGFYWVDK